MVSAAVDHPGAFAHRPHAGHGDVVLIGDVADDLLDDVLQGHHPHQRAVLVDHQGEMLAALAEGLELFQQGGGFGDEPRRRGQSGDIQAVDLAADRVQARAARPWHGRRR